MDVVDEHHSIYFFLAKILEERRDVEKIVNILYLPADTYGEGPVTPIAAFVDGHFAANEAAGTVEDFVSVSMIASSMGMRNAIMGVRCHCCD